MINFRCISQIPGYGSSLPKLCYPQDSFCFFLHLQGMWFSHPLLRFTSSQVYSFSPKPALLQNLPNRWHWHFSFQFPCTEMLEQGRHRVKVVVKEIRRRNRQEKSPGGRIYESYLQDWETVITVALTSHQSSCGFRCLWRKYMIFSWTTNTLSSFPQTKTSK